jgi:hypothetical protein
VRAGFGHAEPVGGDRAEDDGGVLAGGGIKEPPGPHGAFEGLQQVGAGGLTVQVDLPVLKGPVRPVPAHDGREPSQRHRLNPLLVEELRERLVDLLWTLHSARVVGSRPGVYEKDIAASAAFQVLICAGRRSPHRNVSPASLIAMKTLRSVIASMAAILALSLTGCGVASNKKPTNNQDDDQYLKYTQRLQKHGIKEGGA